MNSFKNVFVFFMTLITVMAIFLIADAIFAGLLYLILAFILGKIIAIAVVKWVLFLMFSLELLFTVPAIIKYLDKGGY